jgi:16S rRNA (guanine(966)-N(2))-methyltransferase RsmD
MNMRIIGGIYRSRLISMPKNADIRPTQDKVRQAIFNMLGDMEGSRVLELFAGSGAIGIEAISRGAGHATFVDNDRSCTDTIRANLRSLGIRECSYDIIRGNALETVARLSGGGMLFNIIFLDPPYHKDLARNCLIRLDECDILAPGGLVIVEHFKKDPLTADLCGLIIEKEKRYGDIIVSIYRKTA